MKKDKVVEGIAEVLHNEGLDAYADYKSMGKSAELWNSFRGRLAQAIKDSLELDVKKTAKEYYTMINDGSPKGWEEILKEKKHSGDCGGEPYTCLLCIKEECFEFSRKLSKANIIGVKE